MVVFCHARSASAIVQLFPSVCGGLIPAASVICLLYINSEQDCIIGGPYSTPRELPSSRDRGGPCLFFRSVKEFLGGIEVPEEGLWFIFGPSELTQSPF